MTDGPRLSVLVPVYNEEENLEPLSGEIRKALSSLDYEAIFVDDGSVDRSYEKIREMVKAEPRFRAVRLGRNFGQTAAMAAGIAHARGELIACLDSDLQNHPGDIPAMIEKLEEGYDVVSGWRESRQDAWLTRRLPSQIANAIISWATGVRLHDYGCTLKLYRAVYLKSLRIYGEMHRFIPAFAGFMGARVTEMRVRHRARTRGVSKYGLMRIFKVILDLITVKFMDAYLTKPSYVFGGGGVVMVAFGAAMAAFTLYKKFWLNIFVKDQPLFMVSIFFCLIGFQLLLMGILAEIMIRVYYDVGEKPAYFVREKLGFR